ncbi:hypothetical protein PCCS19_10990 [Paenibacillus sp. CCS19]|nr:hypothetical protein PCCS19_10990 [Paenibacillus cellulosilyticus]
MSAVSSADAIAGIDVMTIAAVSKPLSHFLNIIILPIIAFCSVSVLFGLEQTVAELPDALAGQMLRRNALLTSIGFRSLLVTVTFVHFE